MILRGLQMTLPTGGLPASILALLQQLPQPTTGGQPRDAANTAVMIGVRAVTADTLTIEDCAFAFPQPDGAPDIVGAAVFLQGDCSGLTVRNCDLVSAVPPTFTVSTPQLQCRLWPPIPEAAPSITTASPPALPPSAPRRTVGVGTAPARQPVQRRYGEPAAIDRSTIADRHHRQGGAPGADRRDDRRVGLDQRSSATSPAPKAPR